ncbi:hypothetical protein EDB81DRAFT_716011 [Dactylonectria macrodidyma]|uniref:Uncharacterized protein n=1 Tax=Dactylonectria macrodidyma TaxID=307937 RepID=A0A9P9F7C6_9HYPO|nr:hypothetical protein EDB81DRAFT_716011 [Dactylonectria macrodidyma]
MGCCRRDFPLCSICGEFIYSRRFGENSTSGPDLWHPKDWRTNAIALEGPRLSTLKKNKSDSKHVPELSITRHTATGDRHHEGELMLLQSDQVVEPQDKYCGPRSCSIWQVDLPSNITPLVTSDSWFFGIHYACEEIVNRAMKTSSGSQLRSLGDLWVTLNRRWEMSRSEGTSKCHFVPFCPEKAPGGSTEWGFRGYYNSQCWFEVPSGWWDIDPSHIPNLTTRLLSNLKRVKISPTSPQTFHAGFNNLPQELKDEITCRLLQEPLGLECTYLMPQSCWMQVFCQIPFIWDLDEEKVMEVQSTDLGDEEWDWEKITRRVLARPTFPVQDEWLYVPWEYKDVGLSVPPGFTNRRRIWQIVEEMDPEELNGWEQKGVVLNAKCRREIDDYSGSDVSTLYHEDGREVTWDNVLDF